MSASPPRPLAITGGTGFVGTAVMQIARSREIPVRALTRKPQKPAPHVTWITGSLSDPAALEELCDGAAAVLHIAGVVGARDRAGFEAGNAAGTLAVVSAAKAMSVPRFVHVSSVAAREPDLSDYGWSKARAEKIVAASGLDWTMVRPPAVYGPGDTEMLDLFKMAGRGVVLLPPEGRLSLIHVQDLARLLLALTVQHDDLTTQLFEADDSKPGAWTHSEFARAIGTAMQRGVRPVPVPASLLRLAARADRMVRGAKAKLTPDRAGYLCHPDWTVDPRKRPPAALWQPDIATPAGLKQTVSWYKKAKWL